MNRLYWVNTSGAWAEATRKENEVLINIEAGNLLDGDHIAVAYSVIVINTGSYWYRHYREDGRRFRSLVPEKEVPKPIRLLEMLNEPHASA